jgi:hypothetical protein
VSSDPDAWWPAELFRSAEPHFPDAVDVTGPPRILCFGPYVRLDPGLWRAEAVFELCADAARYDYRVEFGVEGDFAGVVARSKLAGRQTLALTHRLSTPAEVEVRVSLGRAAFHGQFRFVGARVTRLADADG